MIKNDLIEIIKSNSEIVRDYNYNEVRVITDDNILDIVDEFQLLIKKHVVELETKVDVYETFIDKSNFRAFTKKGDK